MIAIINYGSGNVRAIGNIYDNLKIPYSIINQPTHLSDFNKVILPGVGAFEACISNLKNRNLISILNNEVIVKKKPILGICVGMQLLASFSEENGVHEGLGWIPGNVQKLQLPEQFAIPHVGWNDVVINNNCPIFNRTTPDSNFYFDHSYFFNCEEKYVVGYCNYGIKVTAAVQHENIFGVQFHPEKSQTSGLKLFRGFLNSI